MLSIYIRESPAGVHSIKVKSQAPCHVVLFIILLRISMKQKSLVQDANCGENIAYEIDPWLNLYRGLAFSSFNLGLAHTIKAFYLFWYTFFLFSLKHHFWDTFLAHFFPFSEAMLKKSLPKQGKYLYRLSQASGAFMSFV